MSLASSSLVLAKLDQWRRDTAPLFGVQQNATLLETRFLILRCLLDYGLADCSSMVIPNLFSPLEAEPVMTGGITKRSLQRQVFPQFHSNEMDHGQIASPGRPIALCGTLELDFQGRVHAGVF